MPKSEKTPYLVFFYTDWCFQCLQMAPYWRKLLELLEPLGVNLVTVHSEREPSLPRRLNIHALPCIVLILDGNTYVYKGTITSLEKIIGMSWLYFLWSFGCFCVCFCFNNFRRINFSCLILKNFHGKCLSVWCVIINLTKCSDYKILFRFQ